MAETAIDNGNWIGKSVPRIDALGKVTGTAAYMADFRCPGMLWGKILRSPLPHARILHLDTGRAERLPGVRAVVTAADTPNLKYGFVVADELILAADKVRFVGDEVAAVAAVDEETALQALDLIRVDYEPLPAVFDPEEALQPGSPLLHADRPDNLVVGYEVRRGDPEQGLARSEEILEERFVTSSVQQCALEPHICVAQFDLSGKLTFWSSLQSPFRIRHQLARALDLPQSKIRIIQTHCGGAFGGKSGGVHSLYPITALLARKAGRAVKIANSRHEEFAATRPRLPMIIDLKMGCSAKGVLMAKQARIVADAGAYATSSPSIVAYSTRVDSLYRLSNLHLEVKVVYTNKTPCGPFRGYGNPQAHFAVESMMDMMAERLGMDPIELRLKNATQTGDLTAHGLEIRSCGLAECLQRAAKLADWQRLRLKPNGQVGVGVACVIHGCGSRASADFDGAMAYVRINGEGHVTVVSGDMDIGQGANTIFAQIAAAELGVGVESVEVMPLDTDLSPYSLGTYGNRVTLIGGNAVKAAAADARRQLCALAAKYLEADESDLTSQDGRIAVKGSPDKGLMVAQIAARAAKERGATPILGVGSYDPDSVAADPHTKYGNISATYAFGAQIAVVKVDRETGGVQLQSFISAIDLGRAINPMAAEGQIEGAAAIGMGYALSEQLIRHNGQVLNANFHDYKIFTALDAAEIKPILVESNDPVGPFGAKGVAEPSIVPVAPAIANAIYHATGVRLRELPITPERLCRALATTGGAGDANR